LLAVLPDTVLAYGPAPGMELIPYFLALLAWVAMAFAGVLLWPITSLLRRLRRGRNGPSAEGAGEPVTAPLPGPQELERRDGD
jgi:hypothetical protein